jgi:hypothetical protein
MPGMWCHTATYWRALEGGFEPILLVVCSWQPVDSAAFTPYSIDSASIISERAKLFVKADSDAPLAVSVGLDYVAFGDRTDEPQPPTDALRVLSVKDYTMFSLAHYEIAAG